MLASTERSRTGLKALAFSDTSNSTEELKNAMHHHFCLPSKGLSLC